MGDGSGLRSVFVDDEFMMMRWKMIIRGGKIMD